MSEQNIVTGNYDKCGQVETVEHILVKCDACEKARFLLIQALRSLEINYVTPGLLQDRFKKKKKILHLLFPNLPVSTPHSCPL